MSVGDLFAQEQARAGRLGCACPEDAPRALRRRLGEGRLAAGFALVTPSGSISREIHLWVRGMQLNSTRLVASIQRITAAAARLAYGLP